MKFWREIFSLSRWFLLFKLNFVPSLILKGENLQDTEKISVQKCSVSDPYHFDLDPDPDPR